MLRATACRLKTLTIPIKPKKEFILHDGGKDQSTFPELRTETTVESEKLMEYFRTLTTYRRMETLCDQAYKAKKIRGFCHLYIGQEAIALGMCNALDKDDQIVTGYRDHVWYVARGGEPKHVFAEMMGKQLGCSKGKGGSMHMYSESGRFYGGNGIVGAQASLGCGLAWKHSLTNGKENPKNCAVTLYGDGAANQGQIFECFNMASLFKIPCIFVCENNHFGMGTAEAKGSAHPKFYKRCEYIPGLRVDGMDLFAVMEGTRWAREWTTKGNGPCILELDSYRYMGHSMSDPDSVYRTKDDVRKVRDERDCIVHMRKLILDNSVATEAELKAIEKDVKKTLESALMEAEKAPTTNSEELWTDVYAPGTKYEGGLKTPQGSIYQAI